MHLNHFLIYCRWLLNHRFICLRSSCYTTTNHLISQLNNNFYDAFFIFAIIIIDSCKNNKRVSVLTLWMICRKDGHTNTPHRQQLRKVGAFDHLTRQDAMFNCPQYELINFKFNNLAEERRCGIIVIPMTLYTKLNISLEDNVSEFYVRRKQFYHKVIQIMVLFLIFVVLKVFRKFENNYIALSMHLSHKSPFFAIAKIYIWTIKSN